MNINVTATGITTTGTVCRRFATLLLSFSLYLYEYSYNFSHYHTMHRYSCAAAPAARSNLLIPLERVPAHRIAVVGAVKERGVP